MAGRPDNRLTNSLIQSNFLINDDGDVELFDFGISLELEDVNSESDQESWWGSTRYQPPEVLIGEETKSTAADVYAFGGVILQVWLVCSASKLRLKLIFLSKVLSGKPPFADITSHAATVRTIVKGETPNRNAYMFSYPSAIVDELWKLMNECWRSAQKDRPTMAVVIERVLNLLPRRKSRYKANRRSWNAAQPDCDHDEGRFTQVKPSVNFVIKHVIFEVSRGDQQSIFPRFKFWIKG